MLEQTNFDFLIAMLGIIAIITTSIVVFKRRQFTNWYVGIIFGMAGTVLFYFSNFLVDFRIIANISFLFGITFLFLVTFLDYNKFVKKTLIKNKFSFFAKFFVLILLILFFLSPILIIEYFEQFGSFLIYLMTSSTILLFLANMIYLRVLIHNYSVSKLFFQFVIFFSMLSSLTTLLSFSDISLFWDLSYISLIMTLTFIITLALTVLFEDQLTINESIIHEKDTLLQTFIELSPVGVIFTQEGKIQLVNTSLSRINGYSMQEMKKWTVLDILDLFEGEDREKVNQLIINTQEQAEKIVNQPILAKFKNKRGKLKWIEVYLTTTEFQGKASNFIIIIDITEKIELEDNFQLAFLNSPHPIVLVDGLTRKFIIFNDQFKEMFGYDDNELKNYTFENFSLKEDLETKKNIKKSFKFNEYDSFEVKTNTRYKRKNGEIFEVVVATSLIKISEGKYYFITQLLDLTYINDVEYYKKLLLSIEETNKELHSLNLIVSHDVKAPINAIKNLLSLIEIELQDQMSGELKKVFQQISKKINFTSNLIKGILDYSSVGFYEDNFELIDIKELVTEIFSVLQLPKNTNFKINSSIPLIKISKIRIQQVFTNLLSNCIKFSDKEIGIILIDALELPSGDYEFKIEDNGPGIAKENLSEIFQVFKTLRKSPEDSGLGLAIVKKIIKFFGGEISISSELGIKTEVKFTLPKKYFET